MSRRVGGRPNRGGGEQARAARHANEKGRGGRRGGRGGSAAEEESTAPKWFKTNPLESPDGRFIPTQLSSASGIYVNGVGPSVQYASNVAGTTSSSVTFMPLQSSNASSSTSSSTGPIIYRSSVHGTPQNVEVSEEQLRSLSKAITATRIHDLTIQNAILGGGAPDGSSQDMPLFAGGDNLGTPLFASPSPDAAATSSATPSSAPTTALSLASTAAPVGSLTWLRTQVGHALTALQFRRRLVKAVQTHVITPQALAQGFASSRELMAQLQDFRRALGNQATLDHVELVQRATQAAVDWLLVHADESDLPRAFAAHAQKLTVVDTSNDVAVSVDIQLHDKVRYIQDLDLGFSRVDILDAFHQVAGDFADLTSASSSATSRNSTKALEALDENLVLWILFDWFDLRAPPPQSVLDAASTATASTLTPEDRLEIIENEVIVCESMFPEIAAKGRTPHSVRIPVKSETLPEGGYLELAHPEGNLYPEEPPLIVFTHPALSVEAKHAVIHALYEESWSLIGEPMIYTLHTWLEQHLFSTILEPLFPEEMKQFSAAAQAAAREKARLEKEASAEYKKKQAKLSRKEEERLERAEAERKKTDKEYAAKKTKEAQVVVEATSKRIGAAVGLFDKLKAEEEAEEEKRRARIEQMKKILQQEAGENTEEEEKKVEPTTLDSASSPSAAIDSSLLTSFSNTVFADESDADHSLLEEKDALEIQGALEGEEDALREVLFKPLPIDHGVSQQLAKEWEKIKASKKYQDIYAKRQQLPAQLMKADIIRMIQSKQVVVISGSTGCGKSTQTPQFILDACIESGQGSACSIICTQPRRLAAIAVAERVAQERTERIGETVGYSIRLESKRSKKTRLLFCTTGVVLRHLEGSPDLKGISHVIVDEVHERSIDSDFLLIILKGLLARRPDLKLILMSATLNADIFTKYFEGCDTIDIPGRAFPVKSLFLEDIVEATKYEIDSRSEYARKDKPKKGGAGGAAASSSSADLNFKQKGGGKMKDDEVSTKLAQYQESQHKQEVLANMTYIDASGQEVSYSPGTLTTLELLDPAKINYELIVELVKHIVTTNQHVGGSILIFLSGMQEISTLVKEFKRDPLTGNDRQFCIYPLHSLLSSAEQQRVFEIMPIGSGKTKVVISTNIAETSLTIEDVTVVIDSGKMKEMQYDSKSGMSQLVETNVSQANARQRAGRAGRVRPGVCYYLYTQQRSKTLPAQQLPEMLRAPLEQLCLRIKSLNLGSIAAFLSRAIEPPSTAAIEHVVEVLRNYNALERKEEVLTPLGFHLAALPVDARIGKMMIFGCIFRCLDPILTIAAAMSTRNPFVVPFEKRDEVDEIRQRFTPYQSDHLTLLAAYNGWRLAKSKGRNEEKAFCVKNYLSIPTLNMIYEMKKQLCVLLAEIGFLHRAHQSDLLAPNDPVNQHASNIRLIEAVIVAGCYPHIARLDTTGVLSAGDKDTNKRPGRDSRPPRPKWMVREGQVSMHPSSVLFHEHNGFDSPFMVFHELVKTTKIYVRDATIVGSYALLLFGIDMAIHHEKSLVILDDWLSFKIKPRTATLLADLRLELRKLLVEKIQCPSTDLGSTATTVQPANTVDEGNEARSEFRRIGPASMLQGGGSSSAALSGLSSSASLLLGPNASSATTSTAPDLISVVAMLLAEEDIGRKKLREQQKQQHHTSTTTTPSTPSIPPSSTIVGTSTTTTRGPTN